MAHLLPCPGCARHVRASDARCPFCDAALSGGPAPRLPSARLGRAATFAFGAAVATIGASGCAESTVPPDAAIAVDSSVATDSGGGGTDAGGGVDAGGGGTDAGGGVDAGGGADAGGGVDAGTDAGGVTPPYGAPAYGAPPSE